MRRAITGDTFWIWVLSGLFIILGLGYSTLTPIFEQSDETLHYPYVKNLADGNGLPLAHPNQLWNQEATQPPLYYAIVAATTFWIDTDNLLDHLQYNPHWLFTEVRRLINDNQNRVLHGPMDAFPYRQAALAIHIGRWWSLFFGLVTVICTFLIARRLVPNHLPVILSATALAAFTPQFLRISATVSNDSLSAALAALTVLVALEFTEPARPNQKAPHRAIRFNNKHALLLGLLSGLALLTKLSSVTTFFLMAIVIFWRLLLVGEMHQRPWWNLARWLLLAGTVTFALNFWYLWRNYQLYGEWLATETHLDLAGRSSLSLLEVWDLRGEVEWAYWATFGWGQIRLPAWMYTLLTLFSRVGLIGVVWALIYRLALERTSSRRSLLSVDTIFFLIIWAGLNLALYIQWVTQVGSVSHTRLIFPAIAAISLLLAVGWHSLLPREIHRWFSGLVIVGLITLNLYSLGALIFPAFTPGTMDENQPVTNPLDVTFLESIKLTGGDVIAMSENEVTIEARWQTLAHIEENYSVSAVLIAPDGTVLGHRETYPGLGLRPTRYLQPGDKFTDRYPVTLDTGVPEPVVARAVIGLFDYGSDDRTGFPALDSDGNIVTPVVGLLKVVPESWPERHPQIETAVNFDERVKLVGYDLAAGPDGTELTLYWEALAAVPEDYTLFIHLLDDQNNIIVQADNPPTGNSYPTSWWAAGEIITDRHTLPAASDAVRLKLGLYSPETGLRLPVGASTLPTEDNGVFLDLPD